MQPASGVIASCISSPRLRTILTASAKSIAPAHVSAVISPKLCPAIKSGLIICLSCITRNIATLVVKIAGWALYVNVKSAWSLSKHSFFRSSDNASLASSNTSNAILESSHSCFPMPTYCEPCPGK
ncbi:hypothetical protein D3C74_308300 [compost metagenome]